MERRRLWHLPQNLAAVSTWWSSSPLRSARSPRTQIQSIICMKSSRSTWFVSNSNFSCFVLLWQTLMIRDKLTPRQLHYVSHILTLSLRLCDMMTNICQFMVDPIIYLIVTHLKVEWDMFSGRIFFLPYCLKCPSYPYCNQLIKYSNTKIKKKSHL